MQAQPSVTISSLALFPKSNRLLTANDYRDAFKQSRRLQFKGFKVHVSRNARGEPRLGIAVAKRHMKRAVDRNLIKRTIRESFRTSKVRLGSVDCVITITGRQALMSPVEFRQELSQLWSELAKSFDASVSDCSLHIKN